MKYIDTGAGSSGGAYKPPSMRPGASQSASASGGKKMDFGKGPLNKGWTTNYNRAFFLYIR